MRTHHDCPAGMKRCVYCLENSIIGDRQTLLRGEHFYLCAPRGQLAEGYLVIAPYRCVGALSQLPAESFAELSRFKRAVESFYRAAYRIGQPTFYEQGRGGGGAVADNLGGFPLHTHLCSLPVRLDLHSVLTGRYTRMDLSGPQDLPGIARARPYAYVESADGAGEYRVSAYLAHSPQAWKELEQMRLKPMIAALMGLPERGDWRAYPGDRELDRVIMKFGCYTADSAASGRQPPDQQKRTAHD